MLQQNFPEDLVTATSETNTLKNFVGTVFCQLKLDSKVHIDQEH